MHQFQLQLFQRFVYDMHECTKVHFFFQGGHIIIWRAELFIVIVECIYIYKCRREISVKNEYI